MQARVVSLISGRNVCLPLLAVLIAGVFLPFASPSPVPTAASRLGDLPLSFEPNVGQTDSSVRFMVHAPGTIFYFTPSEVVLDITAQAGPAKAIENKMSEETANSATLRLQFVGANASPQLEGGSSLPGKVNYLIGNDPSKWHTGVSTYEGVTYSSLYPGIDLNYTSSSGRLKGTYTVAAGTDPDQIRWRYSGANSVAVTPDGDLQVSINSATPDASPIIVSELAPTAWQEIGNKRIPVPVQYAIAPDKTISFTLGNYNPAHPLTIDPTIAYSTYLGGSGADHALGIDVDADGNIYMSGFTNSTDFPLVNPYQPNYNGGTYDVYVTKLSANGSTMLYSTYLGGSGSDRTDSLAVDGAGNAYIFGTTSSTNLPLVNALQPTYGGGGMDAFVTKLSPTGSALLYSTYLGGNAIDESWSIAVDNAGTAYVTGNTYSANFPLANPYQPVRRGIDDAFVSKIDPAGTALLYSTYFGGSAADAGYGIAIDSTGNAYISGYTLSNDLPLQNPYQANFAGNGDVFITQFNAAGTGLVYSSYLGGSGNDVGGRITLDTLGNAYQTGYTSSMNFPVQNAFQSTRGGAEDAFITKWSMNGSSLIYSSYLGGSSSDTAGTVVVDAAGRASFVGQTQSANFPLVDPIQGFLRGTGDAFVARVSSQGSTLDFSSYYGGSAADGANSMGIDNAGNLYVVGATTSVDFPTLNPVQPNFGGITDGFLVKLTDQPPTPTTTPTNTPTATSTSTPTNSPTSTPTNTPTFTNTPTQTPTNTPTQTATNTSTPTPTPCVPSFTDVMPSEYFYEGVRYLYCNGVISGYPDGTFRPYANTTRGQMAKIVVLAFDIDIYTPPSPTFSDVPSSNPFYQYIETAAYNRIVSGYSDGTYRPYNDVTRGQLSKIVVIAAQWPSIEPPAPTFNDVPPENPFYTFIETAACHRIIGGYADGTFRPGNNATRGQIAKIVHAAVLNQPLCR